MFYTFFATERSNKHYACVTERIHSFDTRVLHGSMFLVAVIVPKTDASKWVVKFYKLNETVTGL